VPKPQFETTVSIGNCIRARKLHSRKSAPLFSIYTVNMNKLRGLSPRANYTDRAAAAGRRN